MKNDFISELEKFKEKHGAIFENKYYKELKDDTDDLVMCINVECERRNECLRFTKTPSEHQYSGLYGKMNGENGCNYFFEPKIKS